MKYPKNRKNNRGVSIIEIVVSMVLIMLVMLVLAFVYPNGRKVTESTDKRTKATEIAKSIMEEIQLIPLFPQAVGAQTEGDKLFHYSLVNISGDKTLNDLISDPSNMKTVSWPYHQLSVNWDATTAKANNPVCPFFITTNADAQKNCIANPSRPFFICTDNGNIPIGISVTPREKLGINRINQTNPIIATITVNVAWGNFVNAENVNNRWHFSYISLVNTRTENIY